MQTELIEQIIHLPIADRIELIERISRSVREDLREQSSSEQPLDQREKAYYRLRGIASVKGKTPPNDDEVKSDFMNYLSEKHR